MSASPKTRSLQTLASLGLALTLPAALAWYYDVYVNWQPRIYPFAIVAMLLGCAALTLLTLWARGEKRKAIVRKTVLSTAVFAAALVGVSLLINNWIGPAFYGRLIAKQAAAVALPLAAAQLLVLYTLLLRKLREPAAAVCAAMLCLCCCFSFMIGAPYMKENREKEPALTRVEVSPQPSPGIGKLEKINDIVVYEDEGYSAFPSIVRTQDGSYLLAFRHAPDPDGNGHLDPESATWLMSSADGRSWGEPRELRRPNGYAAQDPVLNVLEDGTVLMTVFFWRFAGAEQRPLLERTLPDGIEIHSVRGMTAFFGGSYSYTSRDHGENWDGPHLIAESYAIRGRCVELPDKTVLAPMYSQTGVVLFASRDGGLTWEPYSFACGPLGKSQTAHEPALFRTQSGKIFCFIRTNEEMYYCVSDDDGRTFSEPVATGLPGSVPYDALQLPGGSVYLAYGQRKEPYGIRALLLDGECNGISLDREFILRDDGLGSDISYVSSVVLPEGDILSVYYYYTEENDQRRYIAGTALRETKAGG